MGYSREWLDAQGAKYVLATLLDRMNKVEELFVTYGDVAQVLERELNVPKVFPLHVGSVAGRMMQMIADADGNAPPINALVTRSNGIPGKGFAAFYNDLWKPQGGRGWSHLSNDRKIEVVEKIREAVRLYPNWNGLFGKLFGERPTGLENKQFTERDGKPPEVAFPRGEGESAQHRRLKEWAKNNPQWFGLPSRSKGKMEVGILSGDRLDVLFIDGASFVAVEVKSILSSDDDLRRGIYQCIKYRAVLEATEHPVEAGVKAILLTERPLPGDLKERAKALGVATKVRQVNA